MYVAGAVAVAESETTRGELVALLVTVTPPVRLPAEAGAQVTLNEVDCPAESEIGNETPVALKPVPLAATCEMVTVELPVLVRVTFREAALPVGRLPKLNEAGFAESVTTCATPVPLRGTLVGEEGALLTRLRLPDRLPAAAGANEMLNAAEAPGATESGRVSPERL